MDAYLERLGALPMFGGCTNKELRDIARIVDELQVESGRVLMSQGDAGQEAFVIEEGAAEVVRDGQLLAHAFWKEQDPEVRERQKVQFLKNLGLLGGLLLAAVDTEGKPGLAYRAHLASDSAHRAVRTTRREARHAARAAARETKLKAVQAQHALS